ncbi:MAG: BMP family ABC transporter substrate-binding protein [Anaerolineaceae bacterium]|nr:BMP family ABC transporter substrate-binding protein [Anaerolineaceae bacterium]
MNKKLLTLILFITIFAGAVQLVMAQDDSVEDECLAEGSMATEEAVEAADNSDVSFHIILPNARGDRSFIDSAAAGAERAIAELGVEGFIVETAGVQEHDAAVRRAVQEEPNLVITIAVDAAIVEEIVDEFPDQMFAAQESFFPVPPEYDNLAYFTINTHENSYLAGIAAGMLSRTGKVGVVGGGDFPGINQFVYGYEEGVVAACPDCEVVVSYIGGSNPFSDPVRAKEIALGMYEDDVDIIYQVAGRSGEGVLEAASETGNFAIGVDSNQDDTYPGTVIVSAMKRVDNAVFSFVESVVNDSFTTGETVGGMAEGFAGLSWDVGVCSRTFDEYGPEDMVEKLPEVRAAIATAREQILAGEIEVRNALAEAS